MNLVYVALGVMTTRVNVLALGVDIILVDVRNVVQNVVKSPARILVIIVDNYIVMDNVNTQEGEVVIQERIQE